MAQVYEIDHEAAVPDPVERIRALRALAAEHAEFAEQQGCIAPPVLDALKSARLFNITAPKRAGGGSATMRTFVETVAELGKSCAGSAWAFGNVAAATGAAASFSPAITQRLFKNGDELSCYIGAKTGVATPSGSGYLVSGEWAYGSGCLHCDWAWCGVVVRDEHGTPAGMGTVFIDLSAEKATIIRDWNVAGLAASGSNRVKTDGVFVPADLFLSEEDFAAELSSAKAGDAEPRDFWPIESQFGLTLLPPMLGAANAMLDAVRQKMNDRPIISWEYDRQTDSHLLLAMLGEAAIKIDSAWLHVYRACDVGDRIAQEREVTQLERVQIQVDCAYAMRLVREAANMLLDIAGPNAFALTNVIQRHWRDLNIGSRHNSLNTGLSLEFLGRFLTGGKSNFKFMPEF